MMEIGEYCPVHNTLLNPKKKKKKNPKKRKRKKKKRKEKEISGGEERAEDTRNQLPQPFVERGLSKISSSHCFPNVHTVTSSATY